MTTKRLIDVLLGASLVVGAAGCPCPDGHVEDEARFARGQFSAKVDACLADDAACADLCRAVFELEPEATIDRCVITAIDAKADIHLAVTYFEPVNCVGGRRPNGFREPRGRARGAGAWLAKIATVEAASITAFARLVRALERFGAPARFVAAARSALLDEVVHARLTARLARRMGAEVEAPEITTSRERTLAELARENAVEGQVAETFGALLATCQAQLAGDPAVRGVFARIARDEARHAALAHQLAPWFDARLDPAARVAIAEARRTATAEIVAGFDVELAAADRALLGIPDAAPLRRAAATTFAQLG